MLRRAQSLSCGRTLMPSEEARRVEVAFTPEFKRNAGA